MHHMTRTIDDDAALIGNRVVAFLLIGTPGLPTVAAIDDQDRALDALKKLERLRSLERLRRDGAMQGIEFPDPFPFVVLRHSGLRQV